jgi:hypothetical protein
MEVSPCDHHAARARRNRGGVADLLVTPPSSAQILDSGTAALINWFG